MTAFCLRAEETRCDRDRRATARVARTGRGGACPRPGLWLLIVRLSWYPHRSYPLRGFLVHCLSYAALIIFLRRRHGNYLSKGPRYGTEYAPYPYCQYHWYGHRMV